MSTIITLASPLIICIGCGCDDTHACIHPATETPCAWLLIDRAAGVGVCDACEHLQAEWNAGRRHLSTLALVRHHRIERDTVL